MLRGIVKFRARIVDAIKGLSFPSFYFNLNEPAVEKVEIEGPNGSDILTTVHLASIPNSKDGEAIAKGVHLAALDRISFLQGIAIDNGELAGSEFFPVDPTLGSIFAEPGSLSLTGCEARFVVGLTAASLKKELEQAEPPGENIFSLFRLGLNATSPVEKFMILYNILLMLFDDSQPKVDAFIRGQDPNVPLTPDPRPNHQSRLETVYTRLRNELGHKRSGVSLDRTKEEMTKRANDLANLTKHAIELHS